MAVTRDFMKHCRRSKVGREIYQHGLFRLEVTETILKEMGNRGITRKQMAAKISQSERSMSNMLNHVTPLNMKTVTDMLAAMGLQATFGVRSIED